MCELRSATAGVINGSYSLKIEKKDVKQLTRGNALRKGFTVEPRYAEEAVNIVTSRNRYIETPDITTWP